MLYFALANLLLLVLAPWLRLAQKTRAGWVERLGFVSAPHRSGPRIWLHGASAGDLLALLPIIERLRVSAPDCVILVSTITNTGRMMASERLASQVDAIFYLPWDAWGAPGRALRRIRPDVLVLEYTELWPNLIHSAKAMGARIVLTNGRFAPSNMRRYRWLFALAANPLRRLDVLLMRQPEEAERAIALGALPERVFVTGNTKFDALVPSRADHDDGLRKALGLQVADTVLLCGSTHEGEEEVLLEAFARLRLRWPTLKLVLAPRYIDRAPRVRALAEAAGHAVSLRSMPGQAAPVVILDTIGELSRAYRLATLVFVGGSFTTRGGQNILEPAAQGRAVLFGPHMQNFQDSVQLLVGRGGIQVNDGAQLERVVNELLEKPEALERLGSMAEMTVRQVSGASTRNVEHILRVLRARLVPA